MATKKQIREYAEANGITRQEARQHFVDEAIKRNKDNTLFVHAIRHMKNGEKEMAFLGMNIKSILEQYEEFKQGYKKESAGVVTKYGELNDEQVEKDVRNQMLKFITQERWNHCENHGFALSAYALTTKSYEMMKDFISDEQCFVMNFYEAENACRLCGVASKDDAINQIEAYNNRPNFSVKVH